ncbi:MAG: NAD-dependent epimerase/dehydratase family protein [Halobacteriales archaeon]
MDLSARRVLITGGAGHVGSRLASLLVDDHEVVVADDLSVGERDRVPAQATFIEGDLSDADRAREAMTDVDVAFHLAVDTKDVAAGARRQFEANVGLTFSVLEAAIEAGVEHLVFTSSSTVYGEDVPRPTPEDHGPMAPISAYGAAKLAEEGILSTAVEAADMTVGIARLANVVGPVFDGTVVPDFVRKLVRDPTRLEILGDGRQEKSYVYVDDVAEALVRIATDANRPFDVVNVGTPGAITVRRVADIVSAVLEVEPSYSYTGGDRGWTGDVPRMELAVDRLQSLGWTPAHDCEGAVRRAATELAERHPDAPSPTGETG